MSPEDRELLHRHLNGDLHSTELGAFFARLKDSPGLRRELASFSADQALLSEIVLESRHRRPKGRNPWKALAPAAAAAAVLLVGLVLLLGTPSAPPAGTLLASGHETVVHRGGRTLACREGLELRDGDEIRGIARIRTRSGEFLTDRPSRLALRDRGDRLDLREGRVRGRLPGGVFSPSGNVFPSEGAVLDVVLEGRRLRATVESGSARMEAAGGSAQIAAGSYALAGAALETGRAVDRRRVESALAGAWSYLARRKDDLTRSLRDGKRHSEAPPRTYAELGLLALPENDPVAPALLEAMLGKRIESTYTAALQAVALAQLDAAKHRGRIELCHRWLAERQCANGQWDYGSSEPRRPPSGDNSCSAYAALGLRACRDAGIEVDREVARRARAWWLQAQNPDGGWGYNESGQLAPEQASRPDEAGSASYGSATASGVSSILALSSVLGEDSSTHASVRRGLDWIARNHAPDRNPRKAPGFSHLHYWLALERLGLSLGTERLGTHEWYVEGAEFLLSRQGPDGSWKVEDGDFMGRETPGVLDTCLAVLFLRRVPYSREERW